MASSIYQKPVAFAVAATLVVLCGTVATMAYPMFRDDMHPRVPGLERLGPLALAGRDVYQREGCMGCHTQTVRPLPSEVLRYKGNQAKENAAQYSIAGEFAYDHPFLWGSKRTGPDLAFEGWIKPSAAWQRDHLVDPTDGGTVRSNMPAYTFLRDRPVDAAAVQAHMRALAKVGVPYEDREILAAPGAVQGKTELDALVAYLLTLGKAVDRSAGAAVAEVDLGRANPKAGDAAAIEKGRALFAESCAMCHGDRADGLGGDGTPAAAPSLVDDVFLEVKGDLPDPAYFAFVQAGSDGKKTLGRPGLAEGGMPPFAGQLSDDDLWSILAWVREQRTQAR